MKSVRELVVVKTDDGYEVCLRGDRVGQVVGSFGHWTEEQIGGADYRVYWKEATAHADGLNSQAWQHGKAGRARHRRHRWEPVGGFRRPR